MPRCHLSGAEFSLPQAMVLNRRAAWDLLRSLEARAASLRRLIEQLGPLDDVLATAGQPGTPARKRHRLVCRAVAESLSTAFPEARVFVCWGDYRAIVRSRTQARVKATPGPSTASE